MKKNLNFITPKTIFLIFSLVVGASAFSQTNPALEMAGPAAANGVVFTYTTALQKNTDNPSGNTFAAYSTPSALNVTIAVTNQTYTGNNTYNNQPGSIFFGDVYAGKSTTNAPAYQLMNSIGNVSTAASGLKDTLKTQVRIAFSNVNNALKTKHDTAKNSISNVR